MKEKGVKMKNLECHPSFMHIYLVLLYSVAIISIFLCSNVAAEKYEYADDISKKIAEDADNEKRSLVGKMFWIYPKDNAISHIEFYDEPSISGKEFHVSQKEMFEIIDLVHDGDGLCDSNGSYLNYYKIRFKDGKEAFKKTYDFKSEIYNPEYDDINEKYSEKIYKEDPDIIKKRIAKKNAEQKARNAKHNAKRKALGGVRLGMTKEAVLKSNWGKPQHINKTIVEGLIHEQWVYGGGLLYFENGILTAIQN